MKKSILFIMLVAFITGLSINAAEALTVLPQELTWKQSREFKKINSAAEKAFLDVEPQIDTSVYPALYKGQRLMPSENTQSSKYYYVKHGRAELLYERDSKMLRYVTFRKSYRPRTWVVYNYPSGKLRQVDVWLYLNEVYSFNSDGTYIDYKTYKDAITDTVKNNWKLQGKDKLGYAVKGQSKPGVIVLLTIDHTGTIEQCKALRQSKSDAYNNSIYEAVWSSSPFKNVSYPFTTRTMDVQINF